MRRLSVNRSNENENHKELGNSYRFFRIALYLSVTMPESIDESSLWVGISISPEKLVSRGIWDALTKLYYIFIF